MTTLRRVFREQRWLIIGITLVFTLVMLAFEVHVRPTYRAVARIKVSTLSTETPFPIAATEPYAATESRLALLAHRIDVQRDAARTLPLRDRFAFRGLVAAGNNAGRVSIVIPDTDRKRAARRANALADAVTKRYSHDQVAVLDAFRERLHDIRSDLPRGRKANLFDVIGRYGYDQLDIVLDTIRGATEPARVVERATPPGYPFLHEGMLGVPTMMVGFTVAVIAALLVDALRRRPRDPELLAGAAELPLLAAVPRSGGAPQEAYGRAATALDHLGPAPPRTVVVTAPMAGEAIDDTALGLAGAVAAGGRTVALVECDLRRPTLTRRLRHDGPGLLQALRDRDRLADGLQPLDGAPAVLVLPAGGVTTGATELLAGPAFAALLDTLRARADLVLLAAPPLLVTADAGVLVPAADAVVLSGYIGRSAGDEHAAARRVLDRLPARPAGLVVHNAPGAETRPKHPAPRRARRTARRPVGAGTP